MEIAPNFTQVSGDSVDLFRAVAGCCLLWVVLHYAGRLIRHRPHIKVSFPNALTLATIPPILGGSASQGIEPSRVKLSSIIHQDTSALFERVPPPLSLVRAEASPRWQSHPAVHATQPQGRSQPLFPREGLDGPETIAPWERGVIDLRRAEQHRHMSRPSRSSVATMPATHYVVAAGDTLWDIAAKVLETDDSRAVARYWPRLHKENVDVIGRDPNLLRPGQVLSLPPKEER